MMAALGTTLIPLLLRKDALMDGFLECNLLLLLFFCCCCIFRPSPNVAFVAHINEADYYTKLQLIVLAFYINNSACC